MLLKNLKEMKGMKVRLDLVCQYHKKSTDNEGVESIIEVDATMRTKPITIQILSKQLIIFLET